MNEARDKFLTEAMGECWHEWGSYNSAVHTRFCNKCFADKRHGINTDFSTPDGFFKLWNWAQKQEWWLESADWLNGGLNTMHVYEYLINPNRFAAMVYNYLREKE